MGVEKTVPLSTYRPDDRVEVVYQGSARNGTFLGLKFDRDYPFVPSHAKKPLVQIDGILDPIAMKPRKVRPV